MKVTTRPKIEPSVQAVETKAPPKAGKARPVAAQVLPTAARAESKLKGERSQDHAALAQSGAGLSYVHEAPAQAVSALHQRYGVHSSGRAEDRMLVALKVIDDALHTAQPIDALTTHDARRELFHLEALLRLYAPAHEELEHALAKVKQLEDAIGAASSVGNALAKATAKDAPQGVQRALAESHQALVSEVSTLIRRDWAPGKDGTSDAVAKIVKALDKTDFGGPQKDRKFLTKALAGHVEKIRDEHYSLKVLGDGVHALRRQLRWLVLYMEGLHGSVQLAPVKHEDSSYVKILGDAEKEKLYQFQPFAKVVPGEQPIEVPAELYAGLQKSIFDLGAIKDDVEQRDAIARAYKEAGLPKHRLEDLLGSTGTIDDMEERATPVHDLMKQEHLLKRLQHAFEDA